MSNPDQNAMLIESDDDSEKSISKPKQNESNKSFASLKASNIKQKTQKGKISTIQFETIFREMAFVFIPCGLYLTGKRISIVSENIQKRGGVVIQLEVFALNPEKYKESTFIVTSKEITETILQNTLYLSDGEIRKFPLVDCEWISNCLQKNKHLEYRPYRKSHLQIFL